MCTGYDALTSASNNWAIILILTANQILYKHSTSTGYLLLHYFIIHRG